MKKIKRYATALIATILMFISVDTDIFSPSISIYETINKSFVTMVNSYSTVNIEIDIMADDVVLYEKDTAIVKIEDGCSYNMVTKTMSDDIYSDDLYIIKEESGIVSKDDTKKMIPGYLRISSKSATDLRAVVNEEDKQILQFYILKDSMDDIFSLEESEFCDIKDEGIKVIVTIENGMAIEYSYEYYTLDDSYVIIKYKYTI